MLVVVAVVIENNSKNGIENGRFIKSRIKYSPVWSREDFLLPKSLYPNDVKISIFAERIRLIEFYVIFLLLAWNAAEK